jgi:hypothetical protein
MRTMTRLDVATDDEDGLDFVLDPQAASKPAASAATAIDTAEPRRIGNEATSGSGGPARGPLDKSAAAALRDLLARAIPFAR